MYGIVYTGVNIDRMVDYVPVCWNIHFLFQTVGTLHVSGLLKHRVANGIFLHQTQSTHSSGVTSGHLTQSRHSPVDQTFLFCCSPSSWCYCPHISQLQSNWPWKQKWFMQQAGSMLPSFHFLFCFTQGTAVIRFLYTTFLSIRVTLFPCI